LSHAGADAIPVQITIGASRTIAAQIIVSPRRNEDHEEAIEKLHPTIALEKRSGRKRESVTV
jgi:hypothetical protein